MAGSVVSLPADWDITTVGQCCDILDTLRVPVSSEERAKREGDIPYYGANGRIGWIDGHIFDEELVLIAEDGGFFDDYDSRPIAYVIRGKSWVNNHAHVLRALSGITTNLWVYYNLVHRDIRYYIKGGTRSKLNQTELKRIDVPLPPLPEQRRIVQVLDTADRTITQTERSIEKLRAIKSGLLHDLLTRGIGEDGRVRNPEKNPEEFAASEADSFPREWEMAKIVDKFSFPTGQVDPRQQPYRDMPLIAPDHVEARTGRLLATETAAEQGAISGKYLFQPGDVLYSKIRPYLRKAVLADRTGLCSADMYPLRPNADVVPRFLLAVVLGERFSRFAEAVSMRSGFPKINREEMGEYTTAFPKYDEQNRIAEVLTTFDKWSETEYTYLSKLRGTKRGLMSDLLIGRVRVKIPTDDEEKDRTTSARRG